MYKHNEKEELFGGINMLVHETQRLIVTKTERKHLDDIKTKYCKRI